MFYMFYRTIEQWPELGLLIFSVSLKFFEYPFATSSQMFPAAPGLQNAEQGPN